MKLRIYRGSAKATDSFRDLNLSFNYSCGLLRLRVQSDWSQNTINIPEVILRRSWFYRGAFHSTKNSGNSGLWSEWNSHFPEFHSEILGVPREVGLKFRKIGIPGKFRSIRPFLLGPSFSEPGNRIQHG